MTTAILVVAIAGLIVSIATFVRKEIGNRRILASIDQMLDVLQIIKDYRESARVHHVEADNAKSDAAAVAVAVTKKVEEKAVELANKIEGVPAKVAEVLNSGGEGTLLVIPPSEFKKNPRI